MSIYATNGGLWCDFNVVYYILRYLECPIHVWNKNNRRIMAKIGDQYGTMILKIIYGNNHFKPVNKCNNVIDISTISKHDNAYNNQLENKTIKKKKVIIKQKRFTLNFELNDTLLKKQFNKSQMEFKRNCINTYPTIFAFKFIHVTNQTTFETSLCPKKIKINKINIFPKENQIIISNILQNCEGDILKIIKQPLKKKPILLKCSITCIDQY